MASWCTLLVQLLEHPRGISVAENITDSHSHRQRRKDQQAHSPQPLCMRCSHLEQVYGTTPVSSALVAPCSLSPCYYKAGEGFHWGSILCYLMSPTLSINAIELTQWVIKVLSSSELAIPYNSKEIMWWSCDGLVSQPRPFPFCNANCFQYWHTEDDRYWCCGAESYTLWLQRDHVVIVGWFSLATQTLWHMADDQYWNDRCCGTERVWRCGY